MRTHLHHAYRLLNVANAAQAVIYCNRAGWLTDAGRPVPPRPTDDPAITARQRVYLAAFDLHLKSQTDEEKIATRTIMDRMLGPLCDEAGIGRDGRPKRDLIEMLIADQRARRAQVTAGARIAA